LDIANLLVKLAADTSALERGLAETESRLQHTAATLGSIGSKLTLGVTLPLVGIGTAAVKAAVDMDREMRNIQSISQQTNAEIAALSDRFVRMSGDITVTTDSAVKLAEGFYTIQGSGFAGADAMMVLEASTKAASAGLTNTQVAAQAVTASLNAYGENADKAREYSDLMFQTVNIGVGTFEELAGSVGGVVGATAQAGVGFDEVSAALATMSKAGISFAEGATALNGLVMGLIKPSEELTTVLQQMGFESGLAALNALGLSGTLGQLVAQTGGGTEAMANLFPNIRAVRAALSLTREDMGPFNADLEAMRGATEGVGATQAAFAIQMQSTAAQLANLKNNLQGAAISLGEALLPAVNQLMSAVLPLIQRFTEMDAQTRQWIVALAGVAAALGPVLVIVSKLIPLFSMLFSPIGLVAAAVGALSVAFATNFLGIRDAVMPVLEDVKNGLGALAAAFQEGGALAAVQEFGEQVYGVIERAFGTEVADRIATFVEDVRRGIEGLVGAFQEGGALAAVQEFGEQVYGVIERAFGTEVADKIATFVEDVRRGVEGLVGAFQEGGALAAVQEFGEQVYGVIERAFGTEVADKIATFVEDVRRGVEGLVGAFQEGGALAAVQEFGEQVYGVIERAFGTEVADRIATFVEDVRRGIEGLVGAFQEGGALAAVQEFGEQVYGVIERAFGTEVADRIATFVEDVRRGVEGLVGAFQEGGALAAVQEFGEQVYGVIERAFGTEVTDKIATFYGPTWERLKEALGGMRSDFEALVPKLAALWESLQPVLTALGVLAAIVAKVAAEFIVAALDNIFKAIGGAADILSGAIDLVVSLFKGFVAYIRGDAKGQIEALEGMISSLGKIFSGLATIVDSVFGTIYDTIANTVADLLGVNLLSWEELKAWWVATFQDIVDKADEIATTIETTIASLPGVVSGKVKEFITAGKDIIQGVIDGIVAKWKDIKAKVEELARSLPAWVRKVLGMSSPSKVFIEIGLDMMRGLAAGLEKGEAEALKAVADVIQAIAGAFKAMADIAPTVAEFPALTGFKSGLDRLIEDTKTILVAVREELLDLWGWAGERKDTVWGHMVSWAEAVKGVVEVVGLAATTFTEAARYTGLMPGVAERLAADIKQVVVALVRAIGEGGEIDQLKVEWMEFAGSLIGLVVGMIDDLAKLAGYEGDLVVSTANVLQLVGTLQAANDAIVAAFVRQPPVLNEAYRNIQDFIVSWVKLSGAMVSALVGVIGDLTTLSEFEGGLEVSQQNIVSLRKALDDANDAIVAAFVRQPPVLNKAYRNIQDFIVSWIKLAGALVSALVGVIKDLTTLSEFKGELEVSGEAVRNLVWTMNDAVHKILEAMGDAADIASMFDEEGNVVYQIQVKWAEFSAKLVGLFAGMIEDITTLAQFEGGLEVSGEAMRNLVWTMNQAVTVILEAIGDVSSKFDEAGRPLDALKAAWLEFQAGLVSIMAGVIKDMKTLAGYEGDLEISQTAIGDLVEQLGRVADAILEKLDITGRFDEAGNFVDALKVKWAEIATGLVGMFAGAASDLASLADYAPDQAKLVAGIELFFVNLGWFLAEFDRRAVQFAARVSEQGAETAKLIGETVGSLGQAVKPLLDLAEFAITPDQAAVSATLFFGSLETFLIKFAEKAADFESRVSEETAELARIIGNTVKGIGDAVDPLIKILEYKPEVKDIEKKFEEFFYHLERALYWIEWQKEKWVVSDAALELSKRVSQVMGHLKTAVDFLQSTANYAEKNVVSGLTGFLAFITDLERVVVILEKAREKITDEALAAAQEFASGCAKMLSHITDGIDTLNSLPTMELDFYQGGYSVGVGFIQGMIDGLVNNASALYQTVMDIVAAAIAAAEAAAGAASPSREMWALGENMVAGLVGALEAGRSDVARAMAGLAFPQVGVPALAVAGAGIGAVAGGTGTTYTETHYHYHESPGIGADTRASLRQDFEWLQFEERLRGR